MTSKERRQYIAQLNAGKLPWEVDSEDSRPIFSGTKAQPLPDDFLPNPDYLEFLEEHHGIPERFVQAQIPEFRKYWQETGEARKAWQNKFKNHVIYKWKESRSMQQRTASNHIKRLETEQDVHDLIMSGELPEKLAELSSELSAITAYLQQKGLGIGGGGIFHTAISMLSSGRISKGFKDNYMGVADVKAYIEDKDAFKAMKYGVSLEHFKKYKEFKANPYVCSAKTKTGKPCQGGMFPHAQFPEGPADFDPDKKYYCGMHIKIGEYD